VENLDGAFMGLESFTEDLDLSSWDVRYVPHQNELGYLVLEVLNGRSQPLLTMFLALPPFTELKARSPV
jgi:hypothetical protein